VSRGQAQAVDLYYGILACYDLVTSFEEGGADVKITEMNGELVPMLGAKGGWTNKSGKFMFGYNAYYANFSFTDEHESVAGMETIYSGLLLEYRPTPERRLEVHPNLTFGFGFAQNTGIYSDNFDFSRYMLTEPNLGVTYEVFDFVRLEAGLGYRYVFGASLTNSSNAMLSGASYNFGVSFGHFY